ncbi:replication-associated recombination protein A [Candidatus Methanarcanum hacksteinii]|uniref:replication-associated recombination protein A n=1 Tax=Candidatus Methanarcanum hacksteinii TaxID=2911857 RepID=UPI0015ADEF30
MDLFDTTRKEILAREAPLANRMRPKTIEDVVGQEHILGKDKLLYRSIKADRISSLIFYGPPGTGKTTLAQVIANTTKADFREMNATCAGKKDMEDAVKHAQDILGMNGRRTILFIDEIHRFNKGQQDYLLPFVENGTIILIGATTENPYFEVNRALISRSMVLELKPLDREDIITILQHAISDADNGLGKEKISIDDDALVFLADMCNGDARSALNALEIAFLTTDRDADGSIHIDVDVASSCIQKRILGYDKDGDNHYDTISAFIKSMRGSDPDATVYYLARMLYAGEDVKFIARRIMICASEDVSNADPQAIIIATAASQAVERIGMPEARIILAQAAIYVACAPKSNSSITAIDAAMNSVKNEPMGQIPPYLKDAHYSGAKELGRGLTYKYPHNYPDHYVEQQYLPDAVKDRKFYEPSDSGYEKSIKRLFERIGKR